MQPPIRRCHLVQLLGGAEVEDSFRQPYELAHLNARHALAAASHGQRLMHFANFKRL